MTADDLLNDLSDAMGDYTVLNGLASDEHVDLLLREATSHTPEQIELEEAETWRLIIGLETIDWTYSEQERLAFVPKEKAPRHLKHLAVRRASVGLRCLLARNTDQMPQSALNLCLRSIVLFPDEPVFAEHARTLFQTYGDLTGESLSIEEAFFSVSKAASATDALRAELNAMADEAGWVG